MTFVWLHVVVFTFWIVGNLGVIPGIPKWDAYPFELLTMSVSLEAILLSTFVLLSQNRQQAMADQRQKLDLHMNLLTEEKATILLQMMCKLSEQLDKNEKYDLGPEESQNAFSKPTDLLNIVHLVQSENEAEIRKMRGLHLGHKKDASSA